MPINRRTFVKTSAAATVASVLRTGHTSKAKPAARPNILYVFSDQHRAATLPGEAFTDVVAPNIDAFRRANFSMDLCISNYPLCVPYRGILMTGTYSCQSGMTSNNCSLRPTEPTLGKTFAAAGYTTGYVGKWHLGHDAEFVAPGPLRMGFESWHIWGETNLHYHSYTFDPNTGEKISPEGWSATTMTDQTIELLKGLGKGPANKPWFMMLSWNPPHPPFDPPAADQAPFSGKQKLRPNVAVPGVLGGSPPLKSEATFHAAMQGYLGGIQGVDLEFARILKTLEETGQAANTIVVYTSDHGEMMGSQGRMSKLVPYEESCRVPFAVRYPGVIKRGASDAPFAAVDIFPTLCGLAGVTVPATCSGRDHSPILRGEKMEASEMVFLMHGAAESVGSHFAGGSAEQGGEGIDGEGGTMKLVPPYRGCRTKTHTYAVDQKARWLLFDNVTDPYQMKNLAADPAHKPLMDALDVKIQAWMKSTGDPFVYPKFDA